jgi:hypothetical protein
MGQPTAPNCPTKIHPNDAVNAVNIDFLGLLTDEKHLGHLSIASNPGSQTPICDNCKRFSPRNTRRATDILLPNDQTVVLG